MKARTLATMWRRDGYHVDVGLHRPPVVQHGAQRAARQIVLHIHARHQAQAEAGAQGIAHRQAGADLVAPRTGTRWVCPARWKVHSSAWPDSVNCALAAAGRRRCRFAMTRQIGRRGAQHMLQGHQPARHQTGILQPVRAAYRQVVAFLTMSTRRSSRFRSSDRSGWRARKAGIAADRRQREGHGRADAQRARGRHCSGPSDCSASRSSSRMRATCS